MLNSGVDLLFGWGASLTSGVLLRPQLYLDPGSGSYLLQLLIAGLLGAGLVIRMNWNRIKRFVLKLLRRSDDQDAE